MHICTCGTGDGAEDLFAARGDCCLYTSLSLSLSLARGEGAVYLFVCFIAKASQFREDKIVVRKKLFFFNL
jgi:hypothetical protein